ncbi:MAG: hypothetical protein J6A75_06975 [Lachnospiraceae bacterium]|nr:hypothetical protein [Lachnospiraceae bacterium]
MRKTKEKLYVFIIFIVVNVFFACKAEVVKAKEVKYPDCIVAEEQPVITGDMLRYYYQNETQVRIKGNGYNILLNGSDICNYENELQTKIEVRRIEQGIVFTVNCGKQLCGDLRLEFEQYAGDNLYLYNASKDKYELLEAMDSSGLYITQGGMYLLTEKREVDSVAKRATFIGGMFVIVGLIIGYIGMRKRYLFW